MQSSALPSRLHSLDAKGLQALSPALRGRIQQAESAAEPQILVEDASHGVSSLSLSQYLQAQKPLPASSQAFLVSSASGQTLVIPLAKLSRQHLIQALAQNECGPSDLPEPLRAGLEALRSQVQQAGRGITISDQKPEAIDDPAAKARAEKRAQQDFEQKWSPELLDLDEAAFVARFAREPRAQGGMSYALPPELLQELFSRIGPEAEIRTWKQLETALRAIGIPEPKLQQFCSEQRKVFESAQAERKAIEGQPFNKPLSFSDPTFERGEFFQSLWLDQALTEADFVDLMATVFEDGVSQYAVPPETCKAILKSLGKQLGNWDMFQKAFRDVGVPAANVEKIYARVVAHCVARAKVAPDSVLFIASKPSGMPWLNLSEEAAKLRKHLGAKRVIVAKDPSLPEIEALIKTGRFRHVWVSGHGSDGEVLLTNQQGNVKTTASADLARVLASHPAVRSVMASICWGAFGGSSSLVDQMRARGVTAGGFESTLNDDYAVWFSGEIGEKMSQGKSFDQALREAFHEGEAAYKTRKPGGAGFRPLSTAGEYVPPITTVSMHRAFGIAQRIGFDLISNYPPSSSSGHAKMERIFHEYPGLKPVLAYFEAMMQGDSQGCKALLKARPELKPLARALEADWKVRPKGNEPKARQDFVTTLLSRAVNFHVTWLYLKGDKTFLQLDGEQPVAKP